MKNNNVSEDMKELVLARFGTLNPESKITLGKGQEVTVKEVIKHIEEGDEFGKRAIQAHVRMLKVLTGGA